jgi:hypothetical protein
MHLSGDPSWGKVTTIHWRIGNGVCSVVSVSSQRMDSLGGSWQKLHMALYIADRIITFGCHSLVEGILVMILCF